MSILSEIERADAVHLANLSVVEKLADRALTLWCTGQHGAAAAVIEAIKTHAEISKTALLQQQPKRIPLMLPERTN